MTAKWREKLKRIEDAAFDLIRERPTLTPREAVIAAAIVDDVIYGADPDAPTPKGFVNS